MMLILDGASSSAPHLITYQVTDKPCDSSSTIEMKKMNGAGDHVITNTSKWKCDTDFDSSSAVTYSPDDQLRHLMRGNNNTITFLMEVVISESEAMDHMITKTSTRSCDPFKHMVHYTKRKWGTTFGDSYAVTCTLDEQLCVQDKEHVNEITKPKGAGDVVERGEEGEGQESCL
ncbi:hypothetical protein Tco_0811203, partial [Tanacetum coccineum]